MTVHSFLLATSLPDSTPESCAFKQQVPTGCKTWILQEEEEEEEVEEVEGVEERKALKHNTQSPNTVPEKDNCCLARWGGREAFE